MSHLTRVLLLPLANVIRLDEALDATTANPVVVADSYVDGVEAWPREPWGWRTTAADGRTVINIDHHAEDERFFRPISSGNLAIDYVESCGVLPDSVPALINHTDCDSVISAAILTGLLPPDRPFGDAVIAADHTGEPNPIADLLQALDSERDFEASLRNLRLQVRGAPLEPAAETLVAKRLTNRRRAAELVASGCFQKVGPVAVAKLAAGDRISGEFLPALLPDAVVILSATPMENDRLETKIRLGMAAPPGTTLFSLGISRLEPSFRGRWNAGSTKRSGGSTVDPFVLAEHIRGVLRGRV